MRTQATHNIVSQLKKTKKSKKSAISSVRRYNEIV